MKQPLCAQALMIRSLTETSEFNLEGEYLTFPELLKACNFEQSRADVIARRRMMEPKGVILDPNDGFTEKYWFSTKQTTTRRSVTADTVQVSVAVEPDSVAVSLLDCEGPCDRRPLPMGACAPATPAASEPEQAKPKAKAKSKASSTITYAPPSAQLTPARVSMWPSWFQRACCRLMKCCLF
jgi:hypothetical protein